MEGKTFRNKLITKVNALPSMIYIGAETIISPLGRTAAGNMDAVLEGRSGISLIEKAGLNGADMYLSKIPGATSTFAGLLLDAIRQIAVLVDENLLTSERTLVIISSTKGALNEDINDQFAGPANEVQTSFGLAHLPLVISNACISGVLAINTGARYIGSGRYDHVIVLGCDVVSQFVLFGFQSLFAVSDKPCKPFDADRNGITLGEGCGAVVLSRDRTVFKDTPLRLLDGFTANDANHISGPSRTGEGLFRAIKKTLEKHQISAEDIDFLLAHGTATVYNDEMESIAFDRLGLSNIPLNSLKGYFGHTLGAAGLIETAFAMQMMRRSVLVKNAGYETPGTSKPLNVITAHRPAELNMILKTASGFGGGNAALLITKI